MAGYLEIKGAHVLGKSIVGRLKAMLSPWDEATENLYVVVVHGTRQSYERSIPSM